jgi:NAD(P)-dependent dehydrogenase (short-subunit alcohol dehydrogenase family)
MDLKNQKVIIMGGTSGIGLASAKMVSDAGAKAIITGRNPEKLKNALTVLPDIATGMTFDATSADELKKFYRDTGEFDHLILSISGGGGGGPFAGLDSELLKQAFNAKFYVYITAIQLSLPTIRKDGSVTMVTAGSARSPFPGTSGLAAINGALESMLPTLALELKPLRINAVSPGIIDTPWWDKTPQEQRKAAFALFSEKTPVGRIGRAEDVAAAILFLVQNTYMDGTVIECDGGMRIK